MEKFEGTEYATSKLRKLKVWKSETCLLNPVCVLRNKAGAPDESVNYVRSDFGIQETGTSPVIISGKWECHLNALGFNNIGEPNELSIPP